jgi:hypothetical protein
LRAALSHVGAPRKSSAVLVHEYRDWRGRESGVATPKCSEGRAISIVRQRSNFPKVDATPGIFGDGSRSMRESALQHRQDHHKGQEAVHRPQGPFRRFAEHR